MFDNVAEYKMFPGDSTLSDGGLRQAQSSPGLVNLTLSPGTPRFSIGSIFLELHF